MHLHVMKAANLWQQTKGLLGEKNPFPLLLCTRFGIHTFGMKFPLDVIVLDDSYTVQYLKRNLQPNRLFFWNPRYKYVLELPEGSINKLKIKQGILLTLTTNY